MRRPRPTTVPFAVVGVAGLMGLAVAPPPAADGQSQGWAPAGQGGESIERHMAEALREVESAKALEARHGTEIDALATQRKAVEARMHERARALYRITRAGMLPLAGGMEAMLEHMARVQRLERLVQTDLVAVRGLQARALALREELRRVQERAEGARARYQQLEREASSHRHRLAAASQFDQAFEQSHFERPPMGAQFGHGGLRIVDDPPTGLDADFGSLKGRLELPVTGDFRAQDTDVGEGPALLFTTAPGGSVRAAAEGRVAFADQHRDYGTLVIVDHGDSYYTVYGGLARVDVRVGDYVGARARIGAVANDGLLFEVRHRTRSLQPRPWLGF
jgi:murein hydrolase activator